MPPPTVSIVIPVHGVEEHLGRCLDSVLSQPGDIEVIAVDDASPDGCGAILDARARQDPRLRVVHLARNAGPGHARNAGLARAAGDYVWFVDADDLLAAGAVAAVTVRLERDRPDVLLIDYEDLYPDGRTAPSPGRALLRATPAGPLALAERPCLLHLTMTAWSKVIRRAFLSGPAVPLPGPFPAGIHEDVPVTCALLFNAERISVLARVCYRYRRARRGSFMAAPGSAHLAIFSSYEAVLRLAERAEPPLTSEVRAAVFQRAIWHYTTLGGLVPRAARREFFGRMHEDFARYRPAGYRHPPGARGVKFRLVERNAYLAYSALEPVNRVRVLLARAASRLRLPPRPGAAPARREPPGAPGAAGAAHGRRGRRSVSELLALSGAGQRRRR